LGVRGDESGVDVFWKKKPSSASARGDAGEHKIEDASVQHNDKPLDDSELPRPEDVHDISDGLDVDQLVARVSELEQAVDNERNKGLRLMADFQNYQRRAFLNEGLAKQQGIAAVVQSVVPVMDHFDMALKQTATTAGAEQVIEGVRVIREELLKALQQHGVRIISPGVNDDFTPGRHEALMQRAADGVQPGQIVEVFQPGYALTLPTGEERVLRAAKVVVAPNE
jgi:molecular chaperone GrpE